MKLRTHAHEDVVEAAAVPQAFGRVNVLPGGAPPPTPWTPAPDPEPEPVAAEVAPPAPTPIDDIPAEPVPVEAAVAEPVVAVDAVDLLAPPDPDQMVPIDFAPPSPFESAAAAPEPVEHQPEPVALPEPIAPPTAVDQLPPPKAAPLVAEGPLLPAPNVIPGQPLVVPLGSVTPLPGFLDPSDPTWPTSLPAHSGRHLRGADEVAASAQDVFSDPYPMAAATAANQAGLVFSDGSGAPADAAAATGLRSLANRMLHRS
jgi:hypothetical protein